MGPEWLLVGVVIMNHQTIDLKTESCPFSSNGSFHGFVRAKVVHTYFSRLQCPSCWKCRGVATVATPTVNERAKLYY